MHDSHLGHYVNEFSFHCFQNFTYKIWLKMAEWFLRKVLILYKLMILRLHVGQEITLTLNIHIS